MTATAKILPLTPSIEAADPATLPERLRELSATHPLLIALNPSTPPDVLDRFLDWEQALDMEHQTRAAFRRYFALAWAIRENVVTPMIGLERPTFLTQVENVIEGTGLAIWMLSLRVRDHRLLLAEHLTAWGPWLDRYHLDPRRNLPPLVTSLRVGNWREMFRAWRKWPATIARGFEKPKRARGSRQRQVALDCLCTAIRCALDDTHILDTYAMLASATSAIHGEEGLTIYRRKVLLDMQAIWSQSHGL